MPCTFARTATVVAAVVAGWCHSATAQTDREKLPTTTEIVDRYIAVTGGREAHEGVRNCVTRTHVEVTAFGLEMNSTLYQAPPNLFYLTSGSEDFVSAQVGTDGSTVWNLSSVSGPQILTGERQIGYLHLYFFNRWLVWKTLYRKADCVGIEPVEGEPCYKVILVPKRIRHPETHYFSVDSGLLIKSEMVMPGLQIRKPQEIFYSDYQKTDGIATPRRERRRYTANETVFTVQSVEYNVELPPDRFALPPEIKKLLDEQQGAKRVPESQPATTQPATTQPAAP